MKKLTLVLSLLMAGTLASCGSSAGSSQESRPATDSSGSGGESEGFKPSLDPNTECNIKVVGNYSNFEALETEFDRFNEFYPNVELTYTKLDDYDNALPTTLAGNSKPNIFFAEPKMIGNEKYSLVTPHMEDLLDANLKLNLGCLRSSLVNRDSENKVWMVPIFSRTYGFLVNTDLFAKENIKVPSKWSELLTSCEAFINKNYVSPIMGYSKDKKPSSGLMNAIAYPLVIAELSKNPEALKLANDLDPAAGEYLRNGLTKVKTLVDNGSINVTECDKIGDNYEKVLLRFFEGDVPMMVCNGDTVSGAKKRESKSEAYKANPFNYAFYSIPVTEEGGYFIDSPSLEFAVNKDCENLDMTNEFMRFLLQSKELDDMAASKGLISSSKSSSFQPVYAPFNNVPTSRTISPEVIGVKDQLATQIRIASYQVGKEGKSVDEVVDNYGNLN